MKRELMLGLVCAGLAGCAMPPAGAPYGAVPYGAPPTGSLQSARQACNDAYPPRVGNYLPHADCVNQAVERYALPTEAHPDLVRVQESVRVTLSEKIDRGRISVQSGERKMAEADTLIVQAKRERDSGNAAAADRSVARIEALLQ